MTVNLDKFVVVGDKVLIKPKKQSKTTKSGLYLPPGVKEKESVQSGYVMKVGPGFPIPAPVDMDESWKPDQHKHEYIPLQAQEGDLAIYLQSSSWEIEYEGEKFVIVPQNAILLFIRDEE